MNTRPAGTWRVMCLIAGLSVRRRFNLWRAALTKSFGRRSRAAAGANAHPERRDATPRKAKSGSALAAVFGIFFFINSLNIASLMVVGIARDTEVAGSDESGLVAVGRLALDTLRSAEETFEDLGIPPPGLARYVVCDAGAAPRLDCPLLDEAAAASGQAALDHLALVHGIERQTRAGGPSDLESFVRQFAERGTAGFCVIQERVAVFFGDAPAWPHGDAGRLTRDAVAIVLVALFAALLFTEYGMSNKDLGQIEWDLEWLFTFPVPARALLAAKAAGYAAASPFVWFASFPFAITVLWAAGFAWWSVPLGIAFGASWMLALGGLRLAGETYLRTALGRGALKKIQALCTLLGLGLMFGVFALAGGGREMVPHLTRLAVAAPDWLRWLPPALAANAGDGAATAVAAAGVSLAIGAVVFVLCVHAAGARLRRGLVRESGPYQGARRERAAEPRAGAWSAGVVSLDLKLLARDHAFLVQALVIPALVSVFYLAINPSLARGAASDGRHAAALAFGIGSYGLVFTSFRMLVRDREALWLLLTLPEPLERVYARRCVLWSAFAVLFGAVVLAVAVAERIFEDPLVAIDAAMVLVGLPIYSFVAGGIGILATDPFEREQATQISPGYTYLYILLAGVYFYGIYANSYWQKLVLVVLCALVAVALWQKVREYLAVVLDPVDRLEPRIGLSDGMISALMFFVLSGIATLSLAGATDLAVGAQVTIGYAAAGVLTTLFTLYVFWRTGVSEVLRAVGLRPRGRWTAGLFARSVALGGALGSAASVIAALYLALVDRVEPLRRLRDETTLVSGIDSSEATWWWLLVATVAAAPLVEEYLFRGLVFRGLRRTSGPLVSMLASAALFAVVHPPIALVPVFVLGLAAAYAFERTQVLLAPVAAHATYNGIVWAMGSW